MLKKLRNHFLSKAGTNILDCSTSKTRVLYQSYEKTTAFSYIDAGMVHGYEANGAKVILYDAKSDQPPLKKILKKFKPTHFIGFLQEVSREVTPWANKERFELLREHRDEFGMHVALRSAPTNMSRYVHDYLKLEKDILDIATNFFLQPDRPTKIEQEVLSSGFVDIIRSPLHHETFDIAFANLLEQGFSILEEPHAADTKVYHPEKDELTIPILYIGGAWPYKLKNMSGYINKLKEKYSDKARFYGKGWPESYAFNSVTDEEYMKFIRKAQINIALHEPAQVHPYPPNNGNERVFKLLAMKKFVISDHNPILGYHFDVGNEVVVANDPDHMLNLCAYYLEHPDEAEKIANNGFRKVLAEHTYTHRARRLLSLLASTELEKQQIHKYK